MLPQPDSNLRGMYLDSPTLPIKLMENYKETLSKIMDLQHIAVNIIFIEYFSSLEDRDGLRGEFISGVLVRGALSQIANEYNLGIESQGNVAECVNELYNYIANFYGKYKTLLDDIASQHKIFVPDYNKCNQYGIYFNIYGGM